MVTQPTLHGDVPTDARALARSVQAAAELREVLDEVTHLLVRPGGQRAEGGPSDARLAAVLDMSTSAFSRRYGRDTLEAQGRASRRRDA